jgi:hypothetical protein
MIDLGAIGDAAIGGGVIGAAIKLVANLLNIWQQSEQEKRNERIALAGKQAELLAARPDPNNSFVSYTRRVLAWGVCFTFCAVVLLWACFPGYPILAKGGTGGGEVNLFLFHWTTSRDLGIDYTTGAFVWQIVPFMSMILMTYFTPDLRKS